MATVSIVEVNQVAPVFYIHEERCTMFQYVGTRLNIWKVYTEVYHTPSKKNRIESGFFCLPFFVLNFHPAPQKNYFYLKKKTARTRSSFLVKERHIVSVPYTTLICTSYDFVMLFKKKIIPSYNCSSYTCFVMFSLCICVVLF